MVRWLIGIVLVGTVVGALMPAGQAPAAAEVAAQGRTDWGSAAVPLAPSEASYSAATSKSSPPPASAASTTSLYAGTLSLKREANGHFFADAQVNGATVRFLVDTGASVIALSVDDARRAGVRMEGPSSVVGSGASGPVRGKQVTIDRVRLGPQEGRSLEALVIEGGDQSLLGQSFLAKFSSVEIRGDTMTLR